jgi:methylmalonyl-CoA mutase
MKGPDSSPGHKRIAAIDLNLLKTYVPKNKVRFVTATSLFDGHDASINIMRRLLQMRGAEVIHLGHNRTAKEVVEAAIQEDVHAIALSSYQGGHMEYFTYIRDLLDEKGARHVRIYGGGGGVISPSEIETLEVSGISKIYSPEDGQRYGLEGCIGHMLFETDQKLESWGDMGKSQVSRLARALTLLENGTVSSNDLLKELGDSKKQSAMPPVFGVTGTGGAGKSSLLDEILLRFLLDFPKIKIALLCIDPSKKKTGGALLGDRIRINAMADDRLFLRSLASRGSGKELAKVTQEAVGILKSQDFDFIVVETSGIGQGDTGILDVSDISLYVMTPEYGASTQLEKIDMLDFADLIAVNKYERRQGPDAVRDIRTTLRRSRFHGIEPESGYHVYGTIASRFNDDGTNGLYKAIVQKLNTKLQGKSFEVSKDRRYETLSTNRHAVIPGERQNYLGDVAISVRKYHAWVGDQLSIVKDLDAVEHIETRYPELSKDIKQKFLKEARPLDKDLQKALSSWDVTRRNYGSDRFTYEVRGKKVEVESSFETLSGLHLPKVALPGYDSKTEIARFILKENVAGSFPFTAGLFPFRRKGEDPKRQFAGEGGPARTNKRFHYLSAEDDAKRLSTAFDSVTLYGSDPDSRPDIYGKVGESGVSICSLDDIKALYAGFDLSAPHTSVSMTINGPAPMILAMYLNAAIDQQVDLFTEKNQRIPTQSEHQKIADQTLQVVRGTVQADILKEDQAQNTCIFSTEFALKLMGDIQEFFIEKGVRNYYGVSISGYHIAEAGANPITQLAFTLANGFTYVEYYLARGMKIDDFAPNLSFFFSNGIDAEYAVLGRVARRIWAIAMRDLYGANEKSQQLKYHIQTSGRSLHAQEMDFNDIRTTLQALMALYDNCNSLHTNAYDEAVTTPTEESVRRAMAIQMIINHEFGLNKCENVNQGSYFIEHLTDLVEEAVLKEFESISSRGGVLGAMETQYQRSKIQEESMHYEHLKHSGALPLIGVNTYRNPKTLGQDYVRPEVELIRASYGEKDDQLHRLTAFKSRSKDTSVQALERLKQSVLKGENVFRELMNTVRYCSLGEITETLYKVGGQYRRNM